MPPLRATIAPPGGVRVTSPLAIVLPSQQGSVAQARAGLNQRAWPASVDATVWNAYPLADLVARRWDCDAHVFPTTVTGDPASWGPGRWPRIGVDVLGPEHRAVADATWLTSSWLDIDRPAHAPWPDGATSPEADATARAVAAAFPSAAWVYATSAGVRVVHVLDEPVPLRWARWFLGAWVAHARTLLAAANTDLVLDGSCDEWTRCYRLPRVQRDCVAVLDDGNLTWAGGYATDPGLYGDPSRRLVWWPEGDPVAEERTHGTLAGVLAPVAAILGPDGTLPPPPSDWRVWIHGGTAAGRVGDLLSSGAPFGPPTIPAGTRNPQLKTVLNSLATSLARRGAVSPIDLLAIVGPSVVAEAVRDAGAPTLADAWRLAQMAAGAAASRALVKTPDDDRPPPTPGAPTPGGTPPAGTPDGPLPADPPPPIVAPRGKDIAYVYDAAAGTYVGPLAGSGIHRTVVALQPSIPVLRGRTLRPVGDILAAAVDAIRVDSRYPGVAGPPWDPSSRVAVARTFDAPRVEPAHDAAVEAWLDAFLHGNAPAVRDAVLDWLARAHVLDRPIAALYLQGPPGAGKGLLVASVAALWGLEPCGWTEAVGRFNDGLLRSPVVLLDESVTVSRSESGRFRSLVGQSSHNVEAKGRPLVTLRGCPRVIVASNGPDAIDLVGGHGADDLQAIAGRVLHVVVPPAATEYLRAIGGRNGRDGLPGTDGWLWDAHGRPGRVPRYIAWLAATRHVVDGDRFLVAGIPTAWHERLVTDDPVYAAVLLAVATALAPSGGVFGAGSGGLGVWVAPADAPAEHRPGAAWVNPRALHARWKALLVEDGHRPVVQAVARAAKALACGPAVEWDVGGTRAEHWPIGRSLVERVARDAGHGDMGRLGSVFALGSALQPSAPVARAANEGGT